MNMTHTASASNEAPHVHAQHTSTLAEASAPAMGLSCCDTLTNPDHLRPATAREYSAQEASPSCSHPLAVQNSVHANQISQRKTADRESVLAQEPMVTAGSHGSTLDDIVAKAASSFAAQPVILPSNQKSKGDCMAAAFLHKHTNSYTCLERSQLHLQAMDNSPPLLIVPGNDPVRLHGVILNICIQC